jgi:hypothetical protein
MDKKARSAGSVRLGFIDWEVAILEPVEGATNITLLSSMVRFL